MADAPKHTYTISKHSIIVRDVAKRRVVATIRRDSEQGRVLEKRMA